MHIFSKFDHIKETEIVADEAEAVFIKTANAMRDAYDRFMNSTVESANESASLKSKKT